MTSPGYGHWLAGWLEVCVWLRLFDFVFLFVCVGVCCGFGSTHRFSNTIRLLLCTASESWVKCGTILAHARIFVQWSPKDPCGAISLRC